MPPRTGGDRAGERGVSSNPPPKFSSTMVGSCGEEGDCGLRGVASSVSRLLFFFNRDGNKRIDLRLGVGEAPAVVAMCVLLLLLWLPWPVVVGIITTSPSSEFEVRSVALPPLELRRKSFFMMVVPPPAPTPPAFALPFTAGCCCLRGLLRG